MTLILDGTYVYIPKSSDHKRHWIIIFRTKETYFLVKFMSIVLPDDTIGPFYGNENDAKQQQNLS